MQDAISKFSVTDEFFSSIIVLRNIKSESRIFKRWFPMHGYWSRTNGRKKLEELMLAFANGEFDVYSTVIESGLMTMPIRFLSIMQWYRIV
jgi:hypothetical protein